MEKTIKVNEDTYRMINKIAGELRLEAKRPVSMNEALSKLLKTKEKHNIMDFAGCCHIDDKEAEKLKTSIRKMWLTWKPRSY